MADYTNSYWRNVAAPIIEKVLREFPDLGADQERALREAYPFGPKEHHPYKIWRDEIKKQRAGRGIVSLAPSKKLVFGSKGDPHGEHGGAK